RRSPIGSAESIPTCRPRSRRWSMAASPRKPRPGRRRPENWVWRCDRRRRRWSSSPGPLLLRFRPRDLVSHSARAVRVSPLAFCIFCAVTFLGSPRPFCSSWRPALCSRRGDETKVDRGKRRSSPRGRPLRPPARHADDLRSAAEMTERFGKYEIVRKIGGGGVGGVYEARDPVIKRSVAIKTCQIDDPEVRARFAQEAELAGKLHHRNLTTIHDFGSEGSVLYLVCEFLPGEDLDKIIERGDELTLRQ